MSALTLSLSPSDWALLFAHFLGLSLLAVGGAITTVPDMHRYLVDQQAWLSDSQFSASVAIAQAAPGPNVLFVALMGWHVGLNAGGLPWALLGVLVSMLGILMPSAVLTYVAASWGHTNREKRVVRAFKQGMSPVVVALLIATGWVLVSGESNAPRQWPIWALAGVSALLVWRTRIHLLWMLGAGAALGAFGALGGA